ncbi:hypothetical protein ACVMIX_006436 [Rhizobium leguminosarum]
MEFSELDCRWEQGAETINVSNFSDAQKAFILKQGDDGVPVASLRRYISIGARSMLACWFMSLDDARSKMGDWRRDYNPASKRSFYTGEENKVSWM